MKCAEIWGYTSLPKEKPAQPGVVLGFADTGAKRSDWGPATLSTDRCNELLNLEYKAQPGVQSALKIWGCIEKDFAFLFS